MTDQLASIKNFLPIAETLATSGQPLARELELMAVAGYDAVINLAMPDSDNALVDEGNRVTALGMKYLHLPVRWDTPTKHDVELFFRVMEALQGQRVWVHCALNWRVTAFVFLYRHLVLGVSEAEARQAMDTLWNIDDYPQWSGLIAEMLASRVAKS